MVEVRGEDLFISTEPLRRIGIIVKRDRIPELLKQIMEASSREGTPGGRSRPLNAKYLTGRRV